MQELHYRLETLLDAGKRPGPAIRVAETESSEMEACDESGLITGADGSDHDGHEKMIVTIFYPDATLGAQLVGAFHRAVAGLGEMEALDPRPWRLDVLQWPEMQAEATHDIGNSRVVVVPADDAYASSEFFRQWVETW